MRVVELQPKFILIALLILAFTAVTRIHAANSPGPGDVLINEYIPASSPEWVELYNTTATNLDLSDHYIDDIADGGRQPRQIPAGTIIPAHGYYFMDLTNYLNNGGDEIRFLTPSQTVLDTHTYTSSDPEHTWYRYPDGRRWSGIQSPNPTKGSSNPGIGDIPWQPGTFEIRIFDVEQGDSQLIIFPSGYTILIDVSEAVDDSNKGAARIAAKLHAILGTTHINVGVLSHLHLDHIGRAYEGGFWSLLEDEDITFDQIIDRDAGTWIDGSDGSTPDGSCNPDTEIAWHNAGTVSEIATAWLCYATDPASTKIYPIRQLAQRGSTTQIDPPDDRALVEIIQVDAAQVYMSDGFTPLAGNHTADPTPPSENDYAIALKISYGQIDYFTAGDIGGEYVGSTYNDVETTIAPWIGPVEILRVNHHGSLHSTNDFFLNTLSPTTSLISCGSNPYGHPDITVLERLSAVSAVYLTNSCTEESNYSAVTILNDDIILRSEDGQTYSVLTRPYLYLPLILTR